MKKILLTAVLIFLCSNLFAQDIPESVVKMYSLNKNSSFFQIQKAINEHWSSLSVDRGYRMVNGKKTKVPGWKLYKRWEYYWEQRVNRVTGEFPKTNSVDEFKKYINSKSFSATGGTWTNIGIDSMGGKGDGLGRLNCISFHPSNPNIFWVGSPSGGIWRTTNGGYNWTILNNNMSVLGVSDIAVPNNFATSNTMYIATGDRDKGSLYSDIHNSIGVYKSTNGGTNWFETGLTYDVSSNKFVYRLLIHPDSSEVLYASSSDGIYKTTNGGTDWERVQHMEFSDMEFKPGNPNTIYASSLGYDTTYVYKTTNGGQDWTYTCVTTEAIRSEISVTTANSSIIYMISTNSNGALKGIYKSTDSGTSFICVADSTINLLGGEPDGSSTSGQGGFDIAIACAPTDANLIFIGGIISWKSTNGGTNWIPISRPLNPPDPSFAHTHDDKHALAYQYNTNVLFDCNDGGLDKSTNGGTNWINLSNGLIISQIYRISVSQTNPDRVIAGLQDNGTKLRLNGANQWKYIFAADGMECIIDYSNSTYNYFTIQDGVIYRNSNGFLDTSRVIISDNIPGQPKGAWITPFILNPKNSAIIYAGYNLVYKTTDRGDTWEAISDTLSSSKLTNLVISPSDTNVLYASNHSNTWKTTNSGVNWTPLNLPSTTNTLTYIAVKDNDPNTIWITYGGYFGSRAYQSTNGGDNWSDISQGLPSIPALCITQYKSSLGRTVLYAGTDMGVYVKDGNNPWVMFGTGMPNVIVSEIEIYYNSTTGDRLRAATYGRGLWEIPISTTGISVISTELPFDYSLGQNYPNPFNPVTKINFQIPSKANVSMKVYNQLGQEVAVLVNKVFDAGYYSADFDASKLSSGVYFYRLISGNYTAAKKMILLR